MALNALWIAVLSFFGAALLALGLSEVLFPKHLWQRFLGPLWISVDRGMRKYWPGHDEYWNASRLRRYALVPSDVTIASHEDYYDYIGSDRPWQLWWVRWSHRIWGGFLVFGALVLIASLIRSPP
jgi:hypothetical protein